jgi:hypothetical protein
VEVYLHSPIRLNNLMFINHMEKFTFRNVHFDSGAQPGSHPLLPGIRKPEREADHTSPFSVVV